MRTLEWADYRSPWGPVKELAGAACGWTLSHPLGQVQYQVVNFPDKACNLPEFFDNGDPAWAVPGRSR
jgi:hypothetical protein